MNAVEQVYEHAESLGIDALTQVGSIKVRELHRLGEVMAAKWWLDVAGCSHDEYVRRTAHFVLARYTRVSIHPARLRPDSPVRCRMVVTAGVRPGRQGGLEHCGIDALEYRNDNDELLAELYGDWFWLNYSEERGFQVPTEAPPGIAEATAQIPATPAMPSSEALPVVSSFRWTLRETDPNGHVAFQSYLDRGENAIADLGLGEVDTGTWEAWYRRQCFRGESMDVAAGQLSDGIPVALMAKGETKPRAVMRFTPEGPAR